VRRLVLLFVPLVLAGALGAAAGSLATDFVRVPRVSELSSYRPDIITEIRASDGTVIARYSVERRILVPGEDIPPIVKKALVATEDKNFYKHGGMDLARTMSAAIVNIRNQRYSQGASTLTQQLARRVFLSPSKTLSRKINEAFVAFEIERRYSKDQILVLYANIIPWGHGNYGVEAASRYYFGKSVKRLTLAEAALLAGIVQRPADQSPFRNPELARRRRATALRRMVEAGYITDAERRAAESEPLPAHPALKETNSAPYFCEEIRQYLEKTYGEKDLYRRGLRVDSTLDLQLQTWSEEALGSGLRALARRHGYESPRNLAAEGYRDLSTYMDPSWEGITFSDGEVRHGVVMSVSPALVEVRIAGRTLPLKPSGWAWTKVANATKLLKTGDLILVSIQKKKDALTLELEREPKEQGAVLIVENATGAIRAMVGGYDWNQTKFNRAIQALRQAGSTFKPFTYLAALEAGYTPSDTLFDAPLSIVVDPKEPPYSPKNYDDKFRGIVTLRRALENSLNVPTVRLGQLVGLNHVIDVAHRAGIRQALHAYPSMPLGAFEVTLQELTMAYSVFANQGLLYSPYDFDRITDANGDLLEQNKPDAREVANPQACFQLLQMLKGVTQRGTAAAAASLGLNLAGKTGTTNDYTDAWFVGMTPRYTIGVWVGNDMKTTLGDDMTGSRVALPIWMNIVARMKAGGRIDPKADFEAPPNVVFTAVDYDTGLKATPSSPRPILEAFVNGSQPTEEWSQRWEEITRLPWSQQRAYYVPKRGENLDDLDNPPSPPMSPTPGPAPPR
jgi:penicillin-binding protein 1A